MSLFFACKCVCRCGEIPLRHRCCSNRRWPCLEFSTFWVLQTEWLRKHSLFVTVPDYGSYTAKLHHITNASGEADPEKLYLWLSLCPGRSRLIAFPSLSASPWQLARWRSRLSSLDKYLVPLVAGEFLIYYCVPLHNISQDKFQSKRAGCFCMAPDHDVVLVTQFQQEWNGWTDISTHSC